MAATDTIQVRIDHETKAKVSDILETLSINLSDAIKMYLQQIILHKGIPFELKVPSKTAMATIEQVEMGHGLANAKDGDDLIKELNS
ncbi:MAG: hypothetical protein A2Y07_03350 [Planctomycetes bacterium GWF2_50_10]|nr:MAG: hypothetical protein A2Y07_03350 [Planctomycetes bacterium GWF2_50_10]